MTHYTSIYVTWPTAEEQRRQYKLNEEFAWSDREQKYLTVRKNEYKFEKDQTCRSIVELGRKDVSNCYPAELNHEVLYKRGLTYLQKGQYDEAISEFSETLKMIKFGDLYFNRALAYAHKGLYDQAISDFTRATEMGMKAGLSEAFHHRGLAHLEAGAYDKAISDFNTASKSKVEAYFYKAEAYDRGRLIKEAIEAYKTFIQKVPSSLPPLVQRATKRIAELEKR